MKQSRFKLFLLSLIGGSLVFIGLNTILASYQSPPQQPQTVTITLRVEEVEVVLKGLGKLPLEESGNIFFSIKNQAERQLSAPPDTTGKKKEEPKNKKN